jgi:hypothetical protein
MQAAPQHEHRWLERLVGEWTFEGDMESDQPEAKHTGTERVRSLGGVWVLCEWEGQTPEGEPAASVLTLGYDPARGRFVGTFIGSMMAYLWIYEGSLDASGQVLTLESEGPSFTAEGQMAKYRDVMAFESDDHRVFTSAYLGDDGEWHVFMTLHYRRAA